MPTFSAGNRLLADDLMRLPQTVARLATSSNGTTSSGTTDTLDAVMGTVSIVADGSSWYNIKLEGLRGGATGVAGDLIAFTIKDGGGSAPTSASPVIALAEWKPQAIGGAGIEHVELSNDVQLSAGTHTFGVFTQRGSGTSTNGQPLGARQLVISIVGDV